MKLVLCLPLLLVMLNSCSRKSISPPTSGATKNTKPPAVRSDLQAWPSPWWTAKAKISIQNAGASIPLSVTMRAEEGKAIWFSATAFGLLEVARGRIDADSVRILEKMNNRCIRTSMNGLGTYLPSGLGLKQLQHFLMGRVFWDSLETAKQSQKLDTLHVSGKQGEVVYSASLLGKFQLLNASARLESAADFQMINKDFRPASGFPVAFEKEIMSRVKQEEKVIESRIRIEFSRFEFLQQAPEMDFSLPGNCEPMAIK